jgi:hypothetical protein
MMRFYQAMAQLNYVLGFVLNVLVIAFAVGAVRAVFELGTFLKGKSYGRRY